MIPDHIKRPPTLTAGAKEIQQLDDLLKSIEPSPVTEDSVQIVLSKRHWRLIVSLVSTLLWIVDLLPVRRIGISIIRKALNIPLLPEERPNDGSKQNKTNDTPKDSAEDDSLDTDDSTVSDDASTEGDSDDNSKTSTNKNHNGRRTSSDMEDVNFCDHFHADLKAGDRCPNKEIECMGKVYPYLRNGKPREIITFDFTPPFRPTAHLMHDVRCYAKLLTIQS